MSSPDYYTDLLELVASHGYIIVAPSMYGLIPSSFDDEMKNAVAFLDWVAADLPSAMKVFWFGGWCFCVHACVCVYVYVCVWGGGGGGGGLRMCLRVYVCVRFGVMLCEPRMLMLITTSAQDLALCAQLGAREGVAVVVCVFPLTRESRGLLSLLFIRTWASTSKHVVRHDPSRYPSERLLMLLPALRTTR